MISYFENRLSLTIYKLINDFIYNVLQGHRIPFHKIILYKNTYIINCDNYSLKPQLWEIKHTSIKNATSFLHKTQVCTSAIFTILQKVQ